LENFFDLKFRLWQEHRVDPEWLERIPFYEYQIWVDKVNSVVEKDNTEIASEAGKKSVFSLRK
jgi:hypothetical protein